MLLNIALIAVGGAIGSVARYLVASSITRLVSPEIAKFPWGTFCVNVSGSFIAGIIYYFSIRYFEIFDKRLQNALLIGVLGGFTTFSTFALDCFRLTSAGQVAQMLLYVFSSIACSILALFFGFYLMKFFQL